MDIHSLRTPRRRMANSLLSVFLIVCTVIGGILGPWMLPPSQGQAEPLPQQVVLTKSEESDFSRNRYASYGEVITYTLRYEIPAGTNMPSTVLTDDFAGQSNYLYVEYLDSVGPVPIGGTPPVAPVTPTVTPRSGRPLIVWNLGNINNTSGSTWIYEIRYHARIRWDNNGNTSRKAINTATLSWTGGQVTAGPLEVTLVQPANMSFDKAQVPDPNVELNPGAPVTWTLSFRNNTGLGQGTAYDLLITDTMPAGTVFQSVFPVTATYSHVGDKIIFSRPSLVTSTQWTVYGIKASIPPTGNVAHDRLYNEAKLYRTSAPGDVPYERKYTAISDSTTAYIRNVAIGKAQVSPVYGSYNTNRQAEAGEYFTVTIAFTVPQGIVIYRPVLRVLLADGLTFTNPISPTDNPSPITNPSLQDPWRPGGYWLQETWPEMASITNTASGPVSVKYIFRAQALQTYWLNPSQIGVDIPHNTNLNIVPILRWSNNPSQPIDPQHQYFRQRNDTCDGQNVGCVKFIRPDLRYQNDNSGSKITYSFQGGGFGGGTVISFTLNLRNRSETPTHPPAYEVVLTDTLCPSLIYQNASPTPDYVDYGPDGSTRLHWTLADPINPPPDRELFTIWATMPPSIVAGLSVTNTAQAKYTTFPGVVPNKANYVDRPYTAQAVVKGGLAVKKYVTPVDNVRIGDLVTYTVRITLNRGMIMYTPTFVDKLPLGFHYTGTMTIQNGTIITGPVTAPLPADPRYERLSWGLDTIDNTAGNTPMYVTIRYNARQTGKDSRTPAQPVYASAQGDMVNAQTARNELSACWPTYPGSPRRYCLATPLPYAETKVVQPYLASYGSYTFRKLRPEYPPTREYEVGALVNFSVPLKNSGKGPAYEIKIHDVLPPGIAIYNWSLTNLSPPSPPVNFLQTPVQGQTGVISWTLDQLDDGQSVNLTFNGLILANVIPGDLLTNTAYIVDYTSQPGEAVPFERHYRDFDGAFQNDPIPPRQDAPWFSVRGVSISKSDMRDPISPGQILTYTLRFGNSSQQYDATNVKITDTYDTHLTFLNYTTNRPNMSVSHDPANHRIIWTLNTPLQKGGTITDWWIKPYFVLNTPLDQGISTLVNTVSIDGQGDMSGRVTRVEETAVNLPFMTIGKSGNPGMVAPGGTVVYTISFQNIGEYTATGVTVQETYDPNVTFLLASPPPYTGTTNLWYWPPLGPTRSGTIQVTVRVNRPVPAGVEEVVNNVRISCNEVLSTQADPTHTGLSVPKLLLDITDSVDPVGEGNPLTYSIDVHNQGVAATSTVLTDTLDQYTVFSSATPWPINNCVGGVCIWNLGTVAPGEHRQIQLNVVVASSIPGGVTRLVNRAKIGSWEVTPGGQETIEYTGIAGRVGGSIYLPVVLKSYSGTR